jgi:glutamate racemase
LHFVITDSGLGGLAICAGIERALRSGGPYRNVRITYVNTRPEPDSGYSAISDEQARAGMFDRALGSLDRLRPDKIVLACHILSMLYPLTAHSHTAPVPVQGILDAGVNLFYEHLSADPSSSFLILGSRATIHSGWHREHLEEKGIEPERITAVACDGLADAIDRNPDSEETLQWVEKCASDAWNAGWFANRLYVGLCCTHYSYAAEAIRSALERVSGHTIRILDPGQALVQRVAGAGENRRPAAVNPSVRVEVISKIELEEPQRQALARRLLLVSGATAQALLSYRHVPDLF